MSTRNSPEAIQKRHLKDIRHGRHCVFKNFVHLVFVTHYKRGAITTSMLTRMEELTRETCIQMKCELMEFHGEDDHIHLKVCIHPKIPLSNLVGKLKGKTAYFIRQEFRQETENKFLGNHFWSPSYCAVSCHDTSLEVIQHYILDQRSSN